MATRLVVFSSAVIFAGSALAATVNPIKGQVLLNRGDGYKLVSASTDAAPGAQVIVNPHSAGQVVFADGCAVKLEPGAVFTIATQSPCEASGQHVETGGSLKSVKDAATPEASDRRDLAPGLIMGGAAVAVGIGAVLLLRHDDKAASP
jgi:hypothetical protein